MMMEQAFAFHKTARGHQHIRRELPCEDASASYSDACGRFHIAAAADGHGAAECFRSARGSRIAAETAVACLRTFAESVLASREGQNICQEFLSGSRSRRIILRRLTDIIVAEWTDRVTEDLENDPPTEEELGQFGVFYADGQENLHIYGTTLMAALLLPECLILLHQGDGRCDVFYEDGSVDQPIPWDPRCQENITTSMCDSDVGDSVRSCVLDLGKRRVIACLLGSDGVEDAYRDTYVDFGGSHSLMGGVHTFYKDLLCQLAERSAEDFDAYLTEFLPAFSADGKFSETGSGDDVSVAGIVDLAAIPRVAEQFARDTQRYTLEEMLYEKEQQLRSRDRAHGILQRRAQEAQAACQGLETEKKQLVTRREALLALRKSREKDVSQAEKNLEQHRREAEEVQHCLPGEEETLSRILQLADLTLRQFYDRIAGKTQTLDRVWNHVQDKLHKVDLQLEDLDRCEKQLEDALAAAEENRTQAEEAFRTCDERYQLIRGELQELGARIRALEEREVPAAEETEQQTEAALPREDLPGEQPQTEEGR